MSDDVDQNAEARRPVAEDDREWRRLRRVDQLARELMLARPEQREAVLEELATALWPEEGEG